VSDNRTLVPLSASSTNRNTIEYAVRTALADGPATLRLVYVHPPEVHADDSREQAATDLLKRASVWANEDGEQFDAELTIETAQLGTDEYLFSPSDIADTIARDAIQTGANRVLFDPSYDPGIGAPLLRPLEYELARFDAFTVEEAPAGRSARRTPFLARTSLPQIGAIFVISFVFYQILAADPTYWFEIVTGVVSAAIVAIGLSQVTFTRNPTWQTPARLVRHTIYIPYLLKEIIKSNILIAAVILHPKLPIDPRMTRIRPAVWGSLPMTALSNSITLTPGTLAVRIDGRTLTVHTLVPAAREGLFAGDLERAIRFVFYGREAAEITSPEQRGEAELIDSTDEPSSWEQDDGAPTDAAEEGRTDTEPPTMNETDEGDDT